MRISDWSSDVCSSDLRQEGRDAQARCRLLQPCRQLRHAARRPLHGGACRRAGPFRAWSLPSRRGCPRCCRPADRKSVVEGKSVSVRVDLGGGRLIKKTTPTNLLTLFFLYISHV